LVGGDWFVDVYAFSGAIRYTLVISLSNTATSTAQPVMIGEPMVGDRVK
jgi:hypothetical protein